MARPHPCCLPLDTLVCDGSVARIDVVYRVWAPRTEIAWMADGLALEQSVEVPIEAVRDGGVAA